MVSLEPVRILKWCADQEKGEMARLSNFVGATTIGDLLKSTLGPKGMDKLLVKAEPQGEMDLKVSNDGATIIRSLGLDNPAGKIVVDMAKSLDEMVGDGTTSVVVFTSELLKEAERLIARKIHPKTIISGYRLASKVALNALESIAFDDCENEVMFRKNLVNIARTTLSSKILNMHTEKFSNLAVDAILRLKGSCNLKAISFIKILGGTLEDSFLDDGFLLDRPTGKFQPKRIEKAKIFIANTAMDLDKPKCFGTNVKVDSLIKLAELEVAEKTNMKDKIDKIMKFGCNVFVNRQQIYDYPEQLFADAGVMSVELADFEGVERLALVTGGEILSTFDNPERHTLGECEVVEEIMIGEKKVLRFSGVKLGEACTIVLRGSNRQIVYEAQRALHDVLCVLMGVVRDRKIVCGGGACEMAMSLAVAHEAGTVTGKESVAMESYSKALLELPRVLSDNAGYDSAFLLGALRAAHATGRRTSGLDIQNGDVVCMEEIGVIEPLSVKKQIIRSSLEATEVILRVDYIIKSEPRRRKEDNMNC